DARRLLVLVDADPDVLVNPHIGRLASGAHGTRGHALTAPADLITAAPVERGAVVSRTREAKHLWSECAEVHGGHGEPFAEGVDRLAHDADRRVGRSAGPDAEGEIPVRSLERFLRYRRQLIDTPSRNGRDSDAGRKSARPVPRHADVEPFSTLGDGRPATCVADG